MINAAQITAEGPDRKTLDELARAVSLRQSELRESSRDAVIATAIKVLVSIRSQTRVANPKKSGGVIVGVASNLTAGWKHGGSKNSRRGIRCARSGRGAYVKAVILAGPYVRGEDVKVYRVTDLYANTLTVNGAPKRNSYYVIAYSEGQAREYAKKRHERRVKEYAGMAKWTIGAAMAQLSTRGNNAVAALSDRARKTGLVNLLVKVMEHRQTGHYGVQILDGLRYAVPALKGGRASITLAMQKAANAVVSNVMRYTAEHPLLRSGASYRIPFPEIKQKR